MATTIKIDPEIKNRLLKLDIAEKGKSFNTLITELILSYEKNNKDQQKRDKEYDKRLLEHKKAMELYYKQVQESEKEKEMWAKLLKWAKSKGFKE
jgi:hypothetical protein